LDKLSRQNIQNVLKQTNCMSNPEDIIVSALALKYGNPNALMEIGASAGGWGFTSQYIAGSRIFDTYYLVENFSWAQQKLVEHWDFVWPKNQHEMSEHILKNTKSIYGKDILELYGDHFHFKIVDINATDTASIKQMCKNVQEYQSSYYSQELFERKNCKDKIGKIDAIRIDLSIDSYDLHYIVDNILCKENGLLFFDDLNINRGYGRIEQVFSLIRDRNFYPVFFTQTEGLVCRNKWQSKYIVDKMAEDFNKMQSDPKTSWDEFSYQFEKKFSEDMVTSVKETPNVGGIRWTNPLIKTWLQFNNVCIKDVNTNEKNNRYHITGQDD